jgi:hypothetical protein
VVGLREPQALPLEEEQPVVMHDMTDGVMLWGMGFGGLVLLILVLLAIAALAKYVFFR